MKIKLLFFAQLRDLAGSVSTELDIDGSPTVVELLDTLCEQNQANNAFVVALQDPSLMVSVNQQVVNKLSVLNEGDEVGFLPPVSGG